MQEQNTLWLHPTATNFIPSSFSQPNPGDQSLPPTPQTPGTNQLVPNQVATVDNSHFQHFDEDSLFSSSNQTQGEHDNCKSDDADDECDFYPSSDSPLNLPDESSNLSTQFDGFMVDLVDFGGSVGNDAMNYGIEDLNFLEPSGIDIKEVESNFHRSESVDTNGLSADEANDGFDSLTRRLPGYENDDHKMITASIQSSTAFCDPTVTEFNCHSGVDHCSVPASRKRTVCAAEIDNHANISKRARPTPDNKLCQCDVHLQDLNAALPNFLTDSTSYLTNHFIGFNDQPLSTTAVSPDSQTECGRHQDANLRRYNDAHPVQYSHNNVFNPSIPGTSNGRKRHSSLNDLRKYENHAKNIHPNYTDFNINDFGNHSSWRLTCPDVPMSVQPHLGSNTGERESENLEFSSSSSFRTSEATSIIFTANNDDGSGNITFNVLLPPPPAAPPTSSFTTSTTTVQEAADQRESTRPFTARCHSASVYNDKLSSSPHHSDASHGNNNASLPNTYQDVYCQNKNDFDIKDALLNNETNCEPYFQSELEVIPDNTEQSGAKLLETNKTDVEFSVSPLLGEKESASVGSHHRIHQIDSSDNSIFDFVTVGSNISSSSNIANSDISSFSNIVNSNISSGSNIANSNISSGSNIASNNISSFSNITSSNISSFSNIASSNISSFSNIASSNISSCSNIASNNISSSNSSDNNIISHGTSITTTVTTPHMNSSTFYDADAKSSETSSTSKPTPTLPDPQAGQGDTPDPECPDDPALMKAYQECLRTGKPTLLIKEELKRKIIYKRCMMGMDEHPQGFVPSTSTCQLTEEEKMKKKRRQELNKAAAAKFRGRKKASNLEWKRCLEKEEKRRESLMAEVRRLEQQMRVFLLQLGIMKQP